MTLLELVLAALGTYRVARLITADTILDRPRDAFLRWASEGKRKHPKWAEFIVCPWCVGFWTGIAAVALAYVFDGGVEFAESAWFVAPASVLTCSAVAGLLSSWEG